MQEKKTPQSAPLYFSHTERDNLWVQTGNRNEQRNSRRCVAEVQTSNFLSE